MLGLPLYVVVPLCIFLGVVIITTLIGNGLVILAWFCHPPVRKPKNLYYFSLSFADIVVGIFLAPSMMGELILGRWGFGRHWCQAYMLLAWLLSTVSVLHIIAIALDRYHFLFDTFSYMQRRTFPFIMRRIGLIWVAAGWLIVPPMLDWDAIGNRAEFKGICVSNLSKGLSIHLAFGSYFLPIMLLCSTYFAIYKKTQVIIRKNIANRFRASTVAFSQVTNVQIDKDKQKKLSSVFAENCEKEIFLRNKLRRAKMLGILIAAFALSWLPFTVGYTIIGFIPTESRPSSSILPIIVAIGYSNSSMNPIIYAFCNSVFRDGFKKVLFFWRKDTKSPTTNNSCQTLNTRASIFTIHNDSDIEGI